MDRALSGATTPGQSEPASNSNEGVLRILQSSSITGTSPSDCLVSYPGQSLGVESYLSAEVQSVYSTAPADWASFWFCFCFVLFFVFFTPIVIEIGFEIRKQNNYCSSYYYLALFSLIRNGANTHPLFF